MEIHLKQDSTFKKDVYIKGLYSAKFNITIFPQVSIF